jgi:hypothetical protein
VASAMHLIGCAAPLIFDLDERWQIHVGVFLSEKKKDVQS